MERPFGRLFLETGCATCDSHVMRRLHVQSGDCSGGHPDRARAFAAESGSNGHPSRHQGRAMTDERLETTCSAGALGELVRNVLRSWSITAIGDSRTPRHAFSSVHQRPPSRKISPIFRAVCSWLFADVQWRCCQNCCHRLVAIKQ